MRLSNSFGFALFLLLLREKHGVFLLICLFLLITKVFIKFKRVLFDAPLRGGKISFFDDFTTQKYLNRPVSHSARHQRPTRERHIMRIASRENVDNQAPRNTNFTQ